MAGGSNETTAKITVRAERDAGLRLLANVGFMSCPVMCIALNASRTTNASAAPQFRCV
jgi:hypothetical protein